MITLSIQGKSDGLESSILYAFAKNREAKKWRETSLASLIPATFSEN